VLRTAFLLVLALHCAPLAAQGPVALYCARGAGDYPDAEMTFDTSALLGASHH